MIYMRLVPFVLLGSLLAGCSVQPIEYQSGDRMAKGPGLLTQDTPYASEDGFTIYSDSPNQPSLVSQEQTKGRADVSAMRSAQPVSHGKTSVTERPDYEEFEAYQRFKDLPKDSYEYQQFQHSKERADSITICSI